MEHSLWLGSEVGGGGCLLLWGATVAKGATGGDACAAEDEVICIGGEREAEE